MTGLNLVLPRHPGAVVVEQPTGGRAGSRSAAGSAWGLRGRPGRRQSVGLRGASLGKTIAQRLELVDTAVDEIGGPTDPGVDDHRIAFEQSMVIGI